ncbi:MAG: ABC transporter permease [Thermoleophilia bacterium]|nr:ABC transporter permease [Thermoleophilia bacterium]
MQIFRFILIRLLSMLAVLLGAVTLLFVVIYLLVPGDAAQAIQGIRATPESLENLRRELGLDRPLWVQYGRYLWRLLHLDLGTSYQLNRSVSSVIGDYLPATAYLAGAALLLESVVGIGWGMTMAGRRSIRWDTASALSGAVLMATPVFFLGMLLQYIFASRLGILPLSGLGGYNPVNLVLPAVTLAAGQVIIVGALMRAALETEMRKLYFLAARSRGLTHRQAMLRHGTRNALGPVATLLAVDFGTLLGGAMITEIVFAWPGLGRMTYFAAQTRDVPLVLGAVIVMVTLFVVLNSLVDILYRVLNPRLRMGRALDG